ncbi:hypothetical protein BGY98DRAFT_741319 [Russula aff. rugulosa BPL654]|nr:hypothetical protein BGY98DRAFT_741319 [Russula aff. rugulosa BPL654]
MFLSQTLAQIPDPLARWCRASVCDDCEQHASAVSSSRAWQPTRTLQGLYSWYAVSIKAPLRPRVVAVGSIKYRVLSTPFFPRDSSLRVPATALSHTSGWSQLQLQAHPSLRLHLPSTTCPSYGTRSLSRISPASTYQDRQASQNEATGVASRPLAISSVPIMPLFPSALSILASSSRDSV